MQGKAYVHRIREQHRVRGSLGIMYKICVFLKTRQELLFPIKQYMICQIKQFPIHVGDNSVREDLLGF